MAVTTQKQLAQQAGTTSAVQIYSPGTSVVALGLMMFICNYTANIRKYRIFQDEDLTTYTTATALYYDVQIMPYTTHQRGCGVMENSSGSMAIYADAASALTFTLFGTEVDSS